MTKSRRDLRSKTPDHTIDVNKKVCRKCLLHHLDDHCPADKTPQAKLKVSVVLPEESLIEKIGLQGRLGAYLNTMVDGLAIDNKGQYLRDLFNEYDIELKAFIKQQILHSNRELIEKVREWADNNSVRSIDYHSKPHNECPNVENRQAAVKGILGFLEYISKLEEELG